jgi:hypothetical protein
LAKGFPRFAKTSNLPEITPLFMKLINDYVQNLRIIELSVQFAAKLPFTNSTELMASSPTKEDKRTLDNK